MSKEKKLSVARALTTQLHASEEAIDTALAEAAHLIETYVTSRRAINMSAIIGPEVHKHTLEAMIALRDAQEHMSAAHAALRQLQTQIGLAPSAVVPINDKPEKDPEPTEGRLSPQTERAA
ncbi:hypothetical protein PQU92_02135 [Asticcacaulis sp. BYS171W]|uniref:Terminase small subunit n=1 Tax=Asticcacaulis aquaticus TaxID=2984212 RepID=A0ABT5HPR4_9CAUL|nr:hypothetical protein [Asticcacaulis aquaticus]MDC7682054.1 hypothetical protein [Asticcacaulis aquaticus]